MADPVLDPRTGGVNTLLDLFQNGPMATLLVVVGNLVAGVIVVLGTSSLTFEEYLTYGAATGAALSIGRGLAYKGAAAPGESLLDKFNAIPWATVLVYFYAVVGAAVLVVGKSELSFDEYAVLIGAAAATLGFGRGLAAKKADDDPLFQAVDPAFETQKAAEAEVTAALENDPSLSDRPEDEQLKGQPPGMDPKRPTA